MGGGSEQGDRLIPFPVQEHIDPFLAQAESAGARVPAFVKREFDDYLKCGILSHGFARLRCRACGDESLIAFS